MGLGSLLCTLFAFVAFEAKPDRRTQEQIVRHLLIFAALSLSMFAFDSPLFGYMETEPKEGEAISSGPHDSEPCYVAT